MTDKFPPSRRLWVSAANRFACRQHLPEPGSPAWWVDKWQLFGPEEERGFISSAGQPPECDACAAIAELRRIDEEDA